MLIQINNLLANAIKARIFPCAVCGTVTHDGVQTLAAFGTPSWDSTIPISSDAIFDVASLTKSIPTSAIALQLIDQGLLDVNAQILAYLPELSHRHASSMTVMHLLTHTIDFGFSLSSIKDLPPAQILNAIFTRELRSPPGSTYYYSNATSILLGVLVERVTGKSLDALAQERFFTPLQMKSTSFDPTLFDQTRIIPTEFDEWRGRMIKGEIHDESAWKLKSMMIPGSAGLFSTVPDLLQFVRMILNKGTLDGIQFYSASTIDALFTNQIPSGIGSAGLGWELNQPRYMGKQAAHCIGKTGFTGCSIVINRTRGIGIVLLSNFVHPIRKKNADQINEIRRVLSDLVFA